MTVVPRVSVVIASHNAGRVIEECLAALAREPERDVCEVIVADSSSDATADLVARQHPAVRLLHFDRPLTLPQLRGRGIAAARGDIIAILDPFSIVEPGWIAGTLQAHDTHPHPIIGGSVDLHQACRRSLGAWTLFINEYGMFMPPVRYGETWIVPGSNVSYKRAALFDADNRPRYEVFWKTFANWDVEASGHPLLLVPTIAVRLRKPVSFLDYFRTRVDHGRCFSGMRVAHSGVAERTFRAATCPLLPFLLLYRWASVYLAKRRHTGVFLLTLPLQMLLFASWAFGEFLGYARGPGRACERLYY
jgi:cellulose synthase/poly-beta-1,6-N-acetylglucosamine synthase-like glycosyltransferase